MNFLILGDGAEELAWARSIAGRAEHRLWAAYPGFEEFVGVSEPADLDDALATAGVNAVIVGGALEFRAEALRRVAATGLPAICLHPPGPSVDAYYEVAMSRHETGAILVPDLPARLHPGAEAIRRAVKARALGELRGVRHELSGASPGNDLAGLLFPRVVDVVRALLGEIEAVTATGDPPGEHPDEDLVVQLRGPAARRGEVRLGTGPPEPARLVAIGSTGTLVLEYDPAFEGPSRVVSRPAAGGEHVEELAPWDPRGAILAVLAAAVTGREVHPNLLDGTRALELTEAALRSLRLGRTIDLQYEEISEASTFKTVMTSLGCLLLFVVLVALPAALIGPALGLGWTIYIAYAIPPLLVAFILLQVLRFAVRRPSPPAEVAREDAAVEATEGDSERV
jgi:myo-inositol 2-dehydrogenase/D-chiro-inositol 1-dehydrogenase